MKITIRHLVFLFFVLLSGITRGFPQAQNSVQVPQVIPPSPDAAALGKYGNTPIGLRTGIPEINIPLYTVKSGTLQLPISLSYHAGGIKVNEIASWVGLGWALNAGGVVTRSIVGKSDNDGFWYNTIKTAQEITVSDYTYASDIADGKVDGESDYYFYNFNGHAGKFIYTSGVIKVPYLIPKAPIGISFGGTSFTIVDEMGIKYSFGQLESMLVPGQIENAESSYFLTEIRSPDGKDVIQLTYVTESGYAEATPTYTETIGQECTGSGPPQVPNQHLWNSTSSSRTIYPVRLNEILFSGGKVKFMRDMSRTDLSTGNSRLASVEIYNNANEVIKSFVFPEQYFGSGSDARLKLTEVDERDKNGTSVRKHKFYYNESPALPPRGSLAQDWWGYYNGQTANTSLIQTETLGYEGYAYNIGGANRSPDAASMKAGTLNKIVYPTGGYTEFDFEPHYYSGGIVKTPQDSSASAGQMNNTTDLLQETITIAPLSTGWARIHTYCSDVTDATPFFSTVEFSNQTDAQNLVHHVYSPYQFDPYNSYLEKDFSVYLVAGKTYALTVQSKGHSTSSQYNGAAFSQATIYWDESTTGSQVMAGGLRIKEMRDYETAASAPITKIYKYGTDAGAGTGVLLIPEYGMNSSKQEIDFNYYTVACGPLGDKCCPTPSCNGKRMIISSTPPLDLTSLNGAPVVYEQITVFENSVTAPNGKQVYKFDVAEDEFTLADKAFNNGHWQLNNSWKGGDQIWTAVYNANTTNKVNESFAAYNIYNPEEQTGTKIGWKVLKEGCTPDGNEAVYFTFLYYFDYPYYSGIKKLSTNKEISYSSSDPTKSAQTQTDFEYDNLGSQHQQLSRKITLNSDGSVFKNHYWYPADYATSVDNGNIGVLLDNHILAIPVKEEVEKDGMLISGSIRRMDQFGRPIALYQYESSTLQAPSAHNANTLLPTGYVKKADITYDAATKNVRSVQRVDDSRTTYLWGYNNTLPIAEIKNASIGSSSSNFNTSHYTGATVVAAGTDVPLSPDFEVFSNQNITPALTLEGLGTNIPPSTFFTVKLKKSDGTYTITHNCTWGTNSVGSIPLTPGRYQWYYTTTESAGNGFNGYDLDITTSYVSQRTGYQVFHTSFEEDGVTNASAKTGTKVWSGTYEFNLPGINGTYKLSYWSKNGSNDWLLNEQSLTVSTATVQPMTIGSVGNLIDEVRLYPADAVMTTYTYDPSIGITSSTDPNQRTTYYEYDDFGRLKWIKDHEQNIIKSYSYHYKAQ